MTVRYLVGDVRERLAELPDGSVDLVLTSPPFLALRSYLPADHPDKANEIGSESTPAAFLDVLLDLTGEWARVLAPHGSIAVELGDTYSGSGGAGGDYNEGGLRDGQPKVASVRRDVRHARGGDDSATAARAAGKRDSMTPHPGWPPSKSLCMIPQLYAASLAYGRNILTGRPVDPWRVRNVVRWCRPNPPVGALGDKFRPATSEMTVACKARDRYFDLDAVRQPFTGHAGVGTGTRKGQNGAQGHDNRPDDLPTRLNTHDGAPPLDWWEISTQPYAGSHYATWPEALCARPIKAMCPERVCVTCGQPSRRIVRLDGYTDHNGVLHAEGEKWASGVAVGRGAHADKPGSRTTTTTTTTGWTDCGHGAWRNGITLDPFAGSGTTLVVAHRLGRDAIGIDLDARNVELYERRMADHEGGLFLEVAEQYVDVPFSFGG